MMRTPSAHSHMEIHNHAQIIKASKLSRAVPGLKILRLRHENCHASRRQVALEGCREHKYTSKRYGRLQASAHRLCTAKASSGNDGNPGRMQLRINQTASLKCSNPSSQVISGIQDKTPTSAKKLLKTFGRIKCRINNVYVPQHPLLGHWLSIARNKLASSPIFRSSVGEIGRILIYEASNDWLPVLEGQVETPLAIAESRWIDCEKPVKVIPILRAGLVLLERAETLLPASETYHVGYARDENTLQPSMYLNKLPEKFSPEDRILICDPMLATGGTMMALLKELTNRGASEDFIKIVSVVVAPPALEALSRQFSGVKVYCAMIDEKLNDKGFIIPGLGDAGDRAFGNQ